MQKGKEGEEQDEHTWQNGVKYAQDQNTSAERFLFDVPKQWGTEPFKDVVYIKKATKNLCKLHGNITPSYGGSPGVAVPVDEGGGKQEVQVLVDCGYWNSA